MKTQLLSTLMILGYISAASAELVYNIDFEPPAYTNGQQVGGGGGETISDSINGFTSQGLLIHDGGGINYLAPLSFTNGIHLVSWDLAIPTQQASSSLLNAQLIAEGGPMLFSANVAGDGSSLRIEYSSGFPQRPSITINPAQSYAFEILVDLDANYYNFWIDGTLLEDTVSIQSDANLWLVGFGQNQTMGLQAGIDNFRWEVIPEPGTLILLLLGVPCFALVRRTKYKQE